MNNTFVLIFVSILPVFLIGLYIYKKDKEKEPFKLLIKMFLLGAVSCIPAAIFETIISLFFGKVEDMSLPLLFIYVSIGIAFVEELFKWIVVYKNGYNSSEFNHVYDVLVYCAFASLGFACFENILYVFSDSSIAVGLFRGVTAIPAHVCDAILMADYLGAAKIYQLQGEERKEKINLILSILIPTFTHTVYDYCIFSGNAILLVFFVIFLISVYIFSYFKVSKLSNISENLSNNSDKIG